MSHFLTLTPITADTIRATGRYDAPVDKVWRALTQPDLYRQWQSMPGFPVAALDMDLREGGRYRIQWHNDEVGDTVVSGEYRQVSAPHRLVHTELFDEDWTDGVVVCTQP